jgi:hypothetical protein
MKHNGVVPPNLNESDVIGKLPILYRKKKKKTEKEREMEIQWLQQDPEMFPAIPNDPLIIMRSFLLWI